MSRLDVLLHAARAAVNHLEACEGGMIHHPFKSASLPLLRVAIASFEQPYYEIKKSDIGKPTIKAFGFVWPVVNFIGRVLKTDVGKRVFKRGEILQVESNDQRDRRLGRSK